MPWYGSAAMARELIQRFSSEDISDAALLSFAENHVQPRINGRLNGGEAIASPGSLVKSCEAHGVACMAFRARIAKSQMSTETKKEALTICSEFEALLAGLANGTLTDSSVSGNGVLGAVASPSEEFLEQRRFVGESGLDWIEREETREGV